MVREGRADQDEGHLEIAVFVHEDVTGFLFMYQHWASNMKAIRSLQDHGGLHQRNVHISDHAR